MSDQTLKVCPNCGGHHPITACSYALTPISLAAMAGSPAPVCLWCKDVGEDCGKKATHIVTKLSAKYPLPLCEEHAEQYKREPYTVTKLENGEVSHRSGPVAT
jgi:hypothetical protein